jgi:hypothetical protein
MTPNVRSNLNYYNFGERRITIADVPTKVFLFVAIHGLSRRTVGEAARGELTIREASGNVLRTRIARKEERRFDLSVGLAGSVRFSV